MSNTLVSVKDKVRKLQKSGIYAIKCGDCGRIYDGQTKRSIEERFREHMQCTRLNQAYKSAVATHMLVDWHSNITITKVTLPKQVHDQRQLNAYEAYYIQKDINSLNLDLGNVQSTLLKRLI